MFLFFDLDDTLFDHRRANREQAKALLARHRDLFPWQEGEFLALWHDLLEHHFDRHARGELTHQEQRRERMKDLFSRVGMVLTDAQADAKGLEVLADYEGHWQALPDVAGCLEALKDVPLGVISNGTVAQQMDKLRRLGILDRFRAVVVSEQLGISKPKKEIFDEAARRAGARPADCVYVGDKLEVDALGARAAGWRGIWLNRSGEDRPCEGVAVIRSLAELPDILRRTP